LSIFALQFQLANFSRDVLFSGDQNIERHVLRWRYDLGWVTPDEVSVGRPNGERAQHHPSMFRRELAASATALPPPARARDPLGR
jgi:hypothetical protein